MCTLYTSEYLSIHTHIRAHVKIDKILYIWKENIFNEELWRGSQRKYYSKNKNM